MKTVEDLQLFFETEIKPHLEGLEGWRKKARRRRTNKSILFVTFILAPFIVYFFYQLIIRSADVHDIFSRILNALFYIIFIGGAGIFLLLWHILKSIKNPWTKNAKDILFKNIVIKRIVEYISPDLNFSPEKQKVTGPEFLGSEIFKHYIFYPIGYYAEDFVEGKTGNTNIRFYEINGRDMVFPPSKKPNTKIYDGRVEKIPFYGMFGMVDFNKTFNGHTLVLPEKRIGRLQWITASGRKPVKMDNPEFEKIFSVFGTDQIGARYVLSTSLKQRIVDYNKKVGRPINLSFSDNKLYIAIKHIKNKFEFSLKKSVYDFNRVKEFYKDLKIIIDIIEDLNLNTRIWLKQGKENVKLFDTSPNYKYHKKWVYKWLVFPFGLLGLHYFYVGHRGKGIFSLLVSLIFILLGYFFMRTVIFQDVGFFFLYFGLSFFWIVWILVTASWITHDSKGYPLK